MFKYVMKMHIVRRFELNAARRETLHIFRLSSAFIRLKLYPFLCYPHTNPHCKYSLNKEYYEHSLRMRVCVVCGILFCSFLYVYCASLPRSFFPSPSLSFSPLSFFYSHLTSQKYAARVPSSFLTGNQNNLKF